MSLYPWQYGIWQQVVNSSEGGQLPHAFLFTGQKGVGKEHFAKLLSQYLLCEKPIKAESELMLPCFRCKQCKLYEFDSHTDLKLLAPEEGSKVIKIDAIRKVVEFFSQSGMQGGKKVSIITPAEAMNNNAANALLKTLEEPNGASHIILVSHNSGSLLPTVRSRCQVIEFPLPKPDESSEWLASYVGEQEIVEVDELLKLSHNAPLRAKEFQDIGALNESQLMLDELGMVLKREVSPSQVAERWNDDLANLRLSWMFQWLSDIVKVKMLDDRARLDESKTEKMWAYLASNSSSDQLFSLYKLTIREYKLFNGSSNPNRQLSFEYILAQWSCLMRKFK